MNHYTDIKVLSDTETPLTVLMNHLFAKLHVQLGQVVEGRVGVSFPQHGRTLGSILRLHGDKGDLEKIILGNWRKGFLDYADFGKVSPVPQTIKGYRTVQRIQKKSPYNKYKRSVAKGWMSQEEADKLIVATKREMLTLPFVQLESLSTKSMMRIFIKHGSLCNETTAGVFSSYGLSSKSTIPWF